jgi:hypothetical protein
LLDASDEDVADLQKTWNEAFAELKVNTGQ